ncbi:hypothetical protein PV383_44120 [Streptomyces caniscabiei]|uniref:Uncharacterized protein n=1 Tax=Streptomyces caniscabiei TaxID=2746961 RepID=A0ABU4N559_9ACTN|nr:hypothetical protein [Streptomyces caniscabiei]MDX3044102.1 hypothetical protein [Streptomyces caniscabiei]
MATSKSSTPDETRLDDHLDAPSTTAPGDGPADTTDPEERASSATPDKGAAAKAGHGTVNAVVPLPKKAAAERKGKDRTETYEANRPDGTPVTVTRNIETGETSVKEG